jgi:hypothetical protein
VSVNRELPHVFVLPEDDANLRLANEFHLNVDWNRQRQLQVLPVAGGWIELLDLFESVHVVEMHRWHHRFMVLLIDFDGRETRLQDAKARIPVHLTERTFILGALNEPEGLRRALGSYESIGSAMAQDCREGTAVTWDHPLLRHNASELGRLNDRVRRILFPAI